jgi:hypothetical protein
MTNAQTQKMQMCVNTMRKLKGKAVIARMDLNG